MRVKTDAARALVMRLALVLAAHVPEQARQQRQVQLLAAGRRGVELPAVLGHHGVQLAVDVAPLAHPARVQVVLAQQRLVLALAGLVLGRRLQPRLPRLPGSSLFGG